MAFQLAPLPYPAEALEPHVSARTLSFHHGKHHAAYVEKLNELVQGTRLAEKTLEEIVRETEGHDSKREIFNDAAQAWNHAFFWPCMKPGGGGKPSGALATRMNDSFGSFEKFKQ